ncbi:ORF1a [Hana virus]|uniref:ORF1a n=1 Tax=Hana virus TaxID=1286140 RepID=M4JU01_9NIDO|nr:ORF1a [Alphamesonivirus 2]AGE00055.1 ORF1a [Hana virus]
MTYHDYALKDNVVLERDQQLAAENYVINVLSCLFAILTGLLVLPYGLKIVKNPFAGPVSDNFLKRFLQRIIFVFTRQYIYYQVPVFARDESRLNIFLHNDFARLDRNNLNGYCTKCNLYGHTNTEKHNPTIDALVLAKTCKILRYNDKVTKPLAYTVHNIRAYEKNTKTFTDIFGNTTTNIPTKYALAPKKALCNLNSIESNLGPIYVNNTIAYPHLGLIAYNDKQHLQELLANLAVVLDTFMVYTQYELDDTTINVRKSAIRLSFENDFDLTNALTNEMKDPRTPWLLKAKKTSNKSLELEDDTEAEEPQPKRKGKKLKPQTKLLQHTLAKQNKTARNQTPLGFGPTFMTMLCLTCILTSTQAKICTEYDTISQSDVYCNTVQNLTISKYHAYANYEHLNRQCFSTDGVEFKDLIRLSVSNVLNLNNIIKPTLKDDYILKAFSNALPLNTYVLSDYNTFQDLQILMQFYNLNSSTVVYTENYSASENYVGKVVQLLAQGTGGICAAPTCILFTGLATTVTDVEIKVTERLTKRIKHQEHGKPLFVDPSCKTTCTCMDKPKVEPITIEPVKYAPHADFYTQLRYFQNYELRIYDDFEMGVLRYNNYTLNTFIYSNETCILPHGHHCIYNLENFETTRVYNHLGNHLECGVHQEFCESLQQEFMYNEPTLVISEIPIAEEPIMYHKICDNHYTALKSKYPLIAENFWRMYNVSMKHALSETSTEPLATIVIVHDTETIVKTVIADLIHVVEECYDKTALKLTYLDFNNVEDYDQILVKITPLLQQHKILVIEDIDLIKASSARALFSIFDTYEPLVKGAFIIATLNHKRYNETLAFNDYNPTTPASYVDDILHKNWQELPNHTRLPLITRVGDNVHTIFGKQLVTPPEKLIPEMPKMPALNNTSTVINTLTHYSAHILQSVGNDSTLAYNYINNSVYNITESVNDIIYNFTDYVKMAYNTTKYHIFTRYNNMLMAIYDIQQNYYNQYPLRQDFYYKSSRAFDLGQVCDFLHHSDTIIMYQDCVKQNLDEVYVIKLRYGQNANAYHMYPLKQPYTKQTIYELSDAIGFVYKDRKYNYFRPLFTNPGEYVLTIREDYLEYCKSDTSPTPAFAPDANLQCYAYITGVQVIDNFIAEFGIFLMLYTAALIIILAIAVTIRDSTMVMILKQVIIFAYAFGPWLLTPNVFGSYIFVKIYNLIPYTSNTSYGCLLMVGTLAITTIDLFAYLTQRYRAEFTKHVLQLVTLVFELVAVSKYILLPYILTSYGFVLLTIVSYVAYLYTRSQRPNYLKSSVSNAVAHADWVAYRNSTREKTDEAAKSNLSKIINTNVADIKKEQLLECLYLAACHQATVAASTYNPKHYLHIPNYNTKIMFARDNELMNYSVLTTDLKNKSAASNPSIAHNVLELPVTINPLIKYTTRTSVSSLRGAVVNGYIYIQRHLFGNKKQVFEACYNNGKGLLNCKNLDRSKYDIDSAELIGTLIRIPLVDKSSVPNINIHPAPLTYNGPVTLYLSRYDTELNKDVLCVHTGFISEGHHDIKTVFGDCGGMLFDPKGRLLGLHCAGSDDVVFMDIKTGKSNIWTSYKLQHPSEIMITLNNEINLPNPENYDFETSSVVYQHPLRNISATLETLQYLTNKTNAKIAYDSRLLSDFNITAEQYAQHGYYVDYNNFVNNFNHYTTTTIGTKSFETCIKYGLLNNKKVEYHNQASNPFNPSEPSSSNGFDNVMDLLYVFVYMFTHTHPAFYIAAVCVFCLFFIKMNRHLKLIISSIIFAIPHIYVNYYYGLFYMPLKWRKHITALATRYNPYTAVATRYNKNLNIAKDMAKELGTPKNLCTHLATLLKCIKPYPAFSELSQVVNNVDDLMANWANTYNAEELLKQYIDEIYKLYPILFVVFEKIENYEDQIKAILAYISDTGEFDLNGFTIHFDEKEHTINTTDTNVEDIHEKLMAEKASIIALKNMNQEFDIETINNANIGELVRYLIISSNPETLDRDLLSRTAELLARHIHHLRENAEHNDNLITLLAEIYKHKDFLTASHLTSNLRDRNYIMNNLIRVIALFNKQINFQVTQKQYEARRIEEERRKESKQIMEQNNRIRKMQRQNQNIASAIVHMVHACFANRFMLQNESQKIMKALLGTTLELDPTDAEMQHYAAYRNGQVLTNHVIITNFTTLTTILWTGNGYQIVPSMCGQEEFTCTATHKHGYFNCTMEIKDAWYKHAEECAKCKVYYRANRHPRCGAVYDSTVKRYPTLSNFIARYRSCPSCMPCTQCLSHREPGCESASYHIADTAHYQNQAYLTPINIKPDNLEYTFTDIASGDVNAIYNGRIWLMRRTTAITPPPARYRNITNLKLKQTDPEGYYYISEVCPTDLAILNAMINQIQLKLLDRVNLNNETHVEEYNNTIKFNTPLTDTTLDELRTKHKHLLVLKLRQDSEYHFVDVLNFVRMNNLPIFIVHVTHEEINVNHATLYINYLQAWRNEIDDIKTTYDILENVIKNPLDFLSGLVL